MGYDVVPGDERRYTNVRCNDCGTALEPESPHGVAEDGSWEYLQPDGGLHLIFRGGYGMFIDTLGAEPGDLDVLLCAACARKFVDTFGWARQIVEPFLNLNLGHTCEGRGLVWEPMPSCSTDPDLHGWRKVWLVGRTAPSRHTGRPVIVPRAVFDTEAEASTACADGEVVRDSLLGNARQAYPELFAARDRLPG